MTMVHYSNEYAWDLMDMMRSNKISGRAWDHDITLQEMMIFWGILIKMTLRPTPGQSYEATFLDSNWHPYSFHMELDRFRQIRTVLHMNDERACPFSRDSLFKVRPLLNCLKTTFAEFFNLGNKFALDEGSIASKSRYGKFSIFFNATKPGAKYHFHFLETSKMI